MKPRLLRVASFWAAAGAALFVAHDLVAVVQHGPGEELARALRSAGHGYWPVASAALVVAAGAFGLWWLVRLASLASAAVRARRGAHDPAATERVATPPPASWRSRLVHLWPRLFAVVSVAFLLQENVEHLLAHEHLLAADALLGPEYPLAMPVLAGITLAAAALAALVRTGEARLLERIAASRARPPRPTRHVTSLRPDRGRRPVRDALRVLRSGRAPPIIPATRS